MAEEDQTTAPLAPAPEPVAAPIVDPAAVAEPLEPSPEVQAEEAHAAAIAEAPPTEISRVEAAVATWFNEHIANSPVSRFVESANHLTAKLPLLIAAIEGKV